MQNPDKNSLSKKQLLSGVFSNEQATRVGTGTTTKKTLQKHYWLCQEIADGNIETQLLNTEFIPSGSKKIIIKDDFLKLYSPEPEVYFSNVLPKMKAMNKTLALAERHRMNKEYFSAEMEYSNVLKLDIDNVRANFGLGITYLERGEDAKAENIMERLVKLDAAFDIQHKHLFNEFGIDLRKNKMLNQAITYYSRALSLCEHDENLYYNMARVYFEKQDFTTAISFIHKALVLNPGHEVSAKLLFWLVQKKLVPTESQELVSNCLRTIQQAQELVIKNSAHETSCKK